MVGSIPTEYIEQDLAGLYVPTPNYWQMQQRIQTLIDRYLMMEHLNDRLSDLPIQFKHPQPRPWQPIDWHEVSPQQVVGIQLEVFLAVLRGAINTEAPIRQYTQTSRKYLENLHPQLARFVGGVVDETGKVLEPGLWEKEERQHTPALTKVYSCLTHEKITPVPHEARPYEPSQTPYLDLYRHGLHRVATEYGATCLYLWLMAHTTGALQTVFEELVWDEINHMTKFWGFGLWAYPESSLPRICHLLIQTTKGRLTYNRQHSSLIGTLQRMTQVLDWQNWSWMNRSTFAFTCIRSLQRLWQWNHTLTPEYLQSLFGERILEQNIINSHIN
jgi:hypothetical protein